MTTMLKKDKKKENLARDGKPHVLKKKARVV